MRECEARESEWKRSEAASRKRVARKSCKADDAESDLDYLLKRGQQFFTNGDYASAIEVFSHGIKMHPKHGRNKNRSLQIFADYFHSTAKLFNNRSACYLKTKNYLGALEDSSKALELLQPEVESNAQDRAKALSRRALALEELEMPERALIELQAASKIMPDHEGLRLDIQRLLLMTEKEE